MYFSRPKVGYFLNSPRNAKYYVRKFVLQLCITLHCRFDDIQDNSFMRRGVPTAHRVYGLASTISAALYVYFLALQKVLRFNHPKMIKLYIEMNVESWRGQALDVYWRDNYICPSEEEYMEMITKSKYRIRAMSIYLDLCACNKSGNVWCVSECRMYMNVNTSVIKICQGDAKVKWADREG